VGSPWPLFEIFYEQLGGLLIQLWSLARSFPGLQGAALIELLTVAFYGGTIDPEASGSLGLGDAFFTDSTIFSLRSSEYALMHQRYPAHHHRNLLSEAATVSGRPKLKCSHPNFSADRQERLLPGHAGFRQERAFSLCELGAHVNAA